MRIPTRAPEMAKLFSKHILENAEGLKLLTRLHQDFNDPTPDGRYRHWHKLQFLEPPSGLTHERWWLAIKLARNAILRPWPLRDTTGRPFACAVPDMLFEMMHRIDRRASGSIEGRDFISTEKEKRFFLIRSLEEEAITSSQLEGAVTTRKAAKEMLRERKPPRDKSEQMILNNYRGMRFINEQAKQRPLDPALVFELHGILTEGTLEDPATVGQFRRDDDEIAIVDADGNILHDPPCGAELSERLQAMCDFANDDSDSPFIHPVLRSILLHFWLAYDHPFVDGNGRTARALFYWSMARRGYWLIEYTSISRLLLQGRAQYNRAFLYTETDENDATYFVLHQCRTILRAIDELHAYLGRKMDSARRSREILRSRKVAELGLSHRQLALLQHAIENPGTQYAIRSHRAYHRVSYQTARTDLLRLAEFSLFVRAKIGREFTFLAPDNLRRLLEQM